MGWSNGSNGYAASGHVESKSGWQDWSKGRPSNNKGNGRGHPERGSQAHWNGSSQSRSRNSDTWGTPPGRKWTCNTCGFEHNIHKFHSCKLRKEHWSDNEVVVTTPANKNTEPPAKGKPDATGNGAKTYRDAAAGGPKAQVPQANGSDASASHAATRAKLVKAKASLANFIKQNAGAELDEHEEAVQQTLEALVLAQELNVKASNELRNAEKPLQVQMQEQTGRVKGLGARLEKCSVLQKQLDKQSEALRAKIEENQIATDKLKHEHKTEEAVLVEIHFQMGNAPTEMDGMEQDGEAKEEDNNEAGFTTIPKGRRSHSFTRPQAKKAADDRRESERSRSRSPKGADSDAEA
jgi:hypothetical protein